MLRYTLAQAVKISWSKAGGNVNERRLRLGARLRTLRQSRGLTQEQLAEHADLHPTYVAKIEAGMRLPSLEVLERLAAVLKVSLAAIVEAIDEDAGLLSSPDEQVAKEMEVLLRSCSKGQISLVRDFVALIKRYEVSES
ncbi:helix-turn-helix transcriptional regulator [Moorella naiadis]|uniref:helix-turn-helix domain-containing protein n=1 Tax=Moorella naiadis (nom. illeg.) TaxID=3093670 RepID=UPI003D9C949E